MIIDNTFSSIVFLNFIYKRILNMMREALEPRLFELYLIVIHFWEILSQNLIYRE
jgi:hypothetical protein